MDTVRSKTRFRVPAFDGSDNNQVCIFVCCILVEIISTISSQHAAVSTLLQDRYRVPVRSTPTVM